MTPNPQISTPQDQWRASPVRGGVYGCLPQLSLHAFSVAKSSRS